MNPMTLKLEGDLDILKMCLHTQNKATSLRDSKLTAWIQKYENMSQSKVKVKMSKAPNYFQHYRNIDSDQAPAISDQ